MGQILTGPSLAQPRAEALHLVFCSLPGLDRQRHVASLLESSTDVLEGLFEARRDDKLVGAIFAQVMAGRVASIWGPQLAIDEPESTKRTKTTNVVWRSSDFARKNKVFLSLMSIPV